MKHISSRENPQFVALKKLVENGRERRKRGQAILDGTHLVGAYVASYGAPTRLFIRESHRENSEIMAILRGLESVESTKPFIDVVSNSLYDEISGLESASGLLALIAQPETNTPPDVSADSVLLDGLQDPGNVGSILRSAAAAGFGQVLLSADAAQAWSPKTLRAGMGAHFLLNIYEGQDLAAFVANYRGRSLVTVLADSASLYSLDFSDAQQPVAWIFGNEGQGCRPALISAATSAVKIPMVGQTESLNVAATAAICLFETVRQRA